MMEYLKGVLLLLATVITVANTEECQHEVEQLDLGTSSVDDQYLTCRDWMMQNITAGNLLEREKMADNSFAVSWDQANRSCNATITNLTTLHVTALALYTGRNQTFPRIFDQDTRYLGPDAYAYRQYFLSKSLHFLLTDALRILRRREEAEGRRCLLVYAMSGRANLRAEVGAQVRTGSFILASTRRYNRDMDMTIRTCHGVMLPSPLSRYCGASALKVLVPPYEVFRVVVVKKVPEFYSYNRYENKPLQRHFYLESIGTQSNLQCAVRG